MCGHANVVALLFLHCGRTRGLFVLVWDTSSRYLSLLSPVLPHPFRSTEQRHKSTTVLFVPHRERHRRMSTSREASPQPSPVVPNSVASAGSTQSPQGAAAASSASSQTRNRSSSGTSNAATATAQQQQQQPISVLISDMQRAHKHRMGQLKDTAEANFKTAAASAAATCQNLVDVSNAEVIEVFNTETKIEAQIKDVTAQTEQLHKRMAQWAQLFVKFNRSLKEVGDVQHWAQMVEVDMQETVRILDALSAKKRQLVGIESK